MHSLRLELFIDSTGLVIYLQEAVSKDLDHLLEEQTQMDIRMAAFQQMLYVYRHYQLIQYSPPLPLFLFSSSPPFLYSLSFLSPSPNLKTLHGNTQELSTVIIRASELAESVSSKVRVLDLAKAGLLLKPIVPG